MIELQPNTTITKQHKTKLTHRFVIDLYYIANRFVKHNKQHFQAHKADAAGWEKLLQENKLMIKCIIDKDYGEAFVFFVFHCCFFVSIVA